MNLATLSIKNQITIPRDLLAALNFKPQERVLLELEKEDGALVIKPLKGSIVQSVAGSLADKISSSKKGLPFSQILAQTKKTVAQKLAENL